MSTNGGHTKTGLHSNNDLYSSFTIFHKPQIAEKHTQFERYNNTTIYNYVYYNINTKYR